MHSCTDVRRVNVFRGGCINCTPPFLENVEHSSKLNKHGPGISKGRYVNRANVVGGFRSLMGGLREG